MRFPLSHIDRTRGPLAFVIDGAPRRSFVFDPAHIPPFGALDPTETIRYDQRNVVSGWAIAPGGVARVKLMAGGETIAQMVADHPYRSVGEVFRGWAAASRSGFEFVLSMQQLPRGRYPLRVVLENAKGEHTELAGPMVEHDEAEGKVITAAPKYIDPGRIPVSAWIRWLLVGPRARCPIAHTQARPNSSNTSTAPHCSS